MKRDIVRWRERGREERERERERGYIYTIAEMEIVDYIKGVHDIGVVLSDNGALTTV